MGQGVLGTLAKIVRIHASLLADPLASHCFLNPNTYSMHFLTRIKTTSLTHVNKYRAQTKNDQSHAREVGKLLDNDVLISVAEITVE
ncbi:hypothetical protein ACFX2I_026048 [Malus domestica]